MRRVSEHCIFTHRFVAGVASTILAVAACTAPAAAQLENLHDQRAEGGRWCMSDHSHSGSSAGLATRPAAEQAAISNWAGFTAWEYGNHWGSWRIAASRRMSCSQSAGSWSCELEARPCRPLAGVGPSRPRAKARPRTGRAGAPAKK